MQLTTIRKTKLVNIASSAKNILDGFVQIFGSQGVTLSLPTHCFSSLFSVACKFLKLCHFISKLLALVIHFSRLRTKIDPYLEDLPQADFGGVFETISSIGKEKSRTANYVN